MSYTFSKDDIANIHRNYDMRIKLIEENHKQQRKYKEQELQFR